MMHHSLSTVFASRNIANCLHSENRNEFYIDDPKYKGPAYVVKYSFPEEIKILLFRVKKLHNGIVHFLAVDRCLIGKAVQMERCDFVLFDDSTISFVEMKMDSETEDEGLSSRDLRVKAARQLIATINFFKSSFVSNGLQFKHPYIEAIIAVPGKFPKLNSSEKSFVENFAIANDNLPLFISSEKEFS